MGLLQEIAKAFGGDVMKSGLGQVYDHLRAAETPERKAAAKTVILDLGQRLSNLTGAPVSFDGMDGEEFSESVTNIIDGYISGDPAKEKKVSKLLLDWAKDNKGDLGKLSGITSFLNIFKSDGGAGADGEGFDWSGESIGRVVGNFVASGSKDSKAGKDVENLITSIFGGLDKAGAAIKDTFNNGWGNLLGWAVTKSPYLAAAFLTLTQPVLVFGGAGAAIVAANTLEA